MGKKIIVIEENEMIANVEDFQIVSGNPSMIIGTTKKMDAEYLKDPTIKSWYEEWQKI